MNRDHAVMYSFPPYTKYNVFDDFRHIPVSDKRATFTMYIAINKEMSKDMRPAGLAVREHVRTVLVSEKANEKRRRTVHAG